MKKSSIFILTLSIILTLFVAVACSNETAVVEDQLAYVSFGKSGSRAFTTGLSNAPGKDDLFWTYTATKTDGKLNTGAGTQNITGKGISNKQVGPFSVGTWQFTLKGYAEDTHTTLVYDGTSDIVTLTAGTNNAIDVNVVYQPKGGNGKLKLDNVYFNYTGSNVITKLKLDLRNVDSSADSNTYSFEVTNLNPSETPTKFSLDEKTMKAGVYEAKFYFFIGDTLAYTPFIQNIVVLNNRTTTVSGCITEDQAVDQTFNVTTEDYGYVESDGKYYVYVSDEKALQNALNAAGGNAEAVVVLTCDIPTESIEVGAMSSRSISVSLANNVIIDLNGYSITKRESSTASELIKMNAPERTLTIKNSKSSGSIDAKNLVGAKVESGTLIIESGKLSGSVAVKVEAGANVEISGGQLKATGIAIQNGGNLKVKGGTISGTTAIQVVDSNAKTSVESGKLDANTTVSKDETVTGNVDVTIRDDVEIKEGAVTPEIPIKKYTGTGTESDPYCVGSQEAINDVISLISANPENNKVKVIKDITVSDAQLVISCGINLDLNGHTITGNGVRALQFTSGTSIITGSGTIKVIGETISSGSSVIRVGDGTDWKNPSSQSVKLTIGKDISVKTDVCYAISVFGSSTKEEVVVEGKLSGKAGLGTSGNEKELQYAPSIRLESSAEIRALDGYALYLPAAGEYVINGIIEGPGAICTKAGNLTVSIGDGAIITATGKAGMEHPEGYANGPATKNYAVVVENNSSYGGPAAVAINGGEVNGAIFVYDDVKYIPDETKKGTITVTGGTFSSDPSSYTSDYSAAISNTDGTFKVVSISDNNSVFEISNADQLVVFGKLINEKGKTFSNKTVKLTADIDLAGKAWTPIGGSGSIASYPGNTFTGTFDGNGHTISNFVVNVTGQYASAGLFGTSNGATIRNVTVDNANINSTHYAGGILGYDTETTHIINCTVKNSTITSRAEDSTGSWDNGDKVGGIVGYMNVADISGCKVSDTTIQGYRDLGGVIGYTDSGAVTNNTVSNVTIKVDNSHNYKEYTSFAEYDANAIIGEKCGVSTANTYTNVTVAILAANNDELDSAIALIGANNDTPIQINLSAGQFTLKNQACVNKTITIIGSWDDTVLDLGISSGLNYQNGATLTFKDITIQGQPSGDFGGLAHTVKVSFEKCKIEGKITLYSKTDFTNCVFNNKKDYAVWTWGGDIVNFTGCTFNSGGKALLLYGGAGSAAKPTTVLTVTDCVFNDDGTLDTKKAAIEIGNDYNATYVLTVDNVEVNGFAVNPVGTSTGSNIWANKDNMDKDHLHVTINGVLVY